MTHYFLMINFILKIFIHILETSKDFIIIQLYKFYTIEVCHRFDIFFVY